MNSHTSHPPVPHHSSRRRRLSTALPLAAALLAVIGVVLGSALGATTATAAVTPGPVFGTSTGVLDVTVPRATGPVNSVSHEFRLASDNSLITGVPKLLGGQRVILLWNGVPNGDWTGKLTRSGGAVVELGSVVAADERLRHEVTLPAGLAVGSYTVAFTQNGRELLPTFGFVVGSPVAPAAGTSNQPSSAGNSGAGLGASSTSADNVSALSGTSNNGAGVTPSGGTAGGVTPSGAAPVGSGPAGLAAASAVKAKDQGLITVGGVRTAYQGSLNPFDSAIDVSYTVANTGNIPIRGAVVITVGGPLAVLARSDSREIGDIAPGQSRTFTTRVTGADQAGLLSVGVRLLPRSSKAAMLPPVDREASLTAIPWSALTLLGAGGGAAFLVRRRRQLGVGAGPTGAHSFVPAAAAGV